MPDYRRARVDGATYFFTVNLADRRERLLTAHIDVLRCALSETRASLPFKLDAIVVLPEHLHCLWTLPPGDTDYSDRWRRIKGAFSRGLDVCTFGRPGAGRKGERGIWQRRFWEHVIRDEHDYVSHLDYVHHNPVKHGHAQRAADWPYSSFHRYVRAGFYPREWAAPESTDRRTGEADGS